MQHAANQHPSNAALPDADHPANAPAGWRVQRRALAMLVCASLAVVMLLGLLWSRVVAANQSLGHANVLSASPLIGRTAPDFTIQTWTAHGSPSQTVHLAAYQGHPVLINFWASWCDACHAEEANLMAAWRQYQPRGVIFIGVAYQDTQAAGTAFLAQYHVTFPSGPDPTGAIGIAYGVSGVPETVFISRAGAVVSEATGPLDAGTLARSLQAIAR
jgi:cytochrome c biogenesis protein CcmG/thiol:disulfide interchange protein DsbE